MEDLSAFGARGKDDELAPAPLVLLPGLLCDREVWKSQIERFEGSREVIVPVLTGCASIAELAVATLSQLPSRFDLIGFSMGGYVAMQVALREPDRVETLALIDTTARPDSWAVSERRRRLVEMAGREGVVAAAKEMVPALVSDHRQEDPAVVGPWLSMADRVGVAGFRNQQAAIIDRPDARPDLHRIGCPTLVVYGELDAIAPPEDQEEMAGLIPDARLHRLSDCGHLSLLEEPARVDDVLTEWLTDRVAMPISQADAALTSDPKES